MNVFTDWQPTMQSVVDRFKPKKILELGLGDGTEWLLNHFDKVHSVEILANPELEHWYKDMAEKYKDYKNWTTMLYSSEDKVSPFIRTQIKNQITMFKPDVVFVDPGVHFRGDLVNQVMKLSVKYILAHDTQCGFDEDDIYGWNSIKPEGYTTEQVYEGQGTTLWIKN